MVKNIVCFIYFFIQVDDFSAQSQAAINKLIVPAIEDGWMEVNEGEQISKHLLQFGWPIVAEEAWAIEGVREEVAVKVMLHDRWTLWCGWGKQSLSTESQMISAHVVSVGDFGSGSSSNTENFEGGRLGLIARVKGLHWGLVAERDAGEVGVDHLGGYVEKRLVNGVHFLIGDHRVHWGSGSTVFRYDPFQSMRAPHNLGQISRDFSGVNTGDGTPIRRGFSVSKTNANWCVSTSFDSQRKDCAVDTVTGEITSMYSSGLHRTATERSRLELRQSRLAWSILYKSPRTMFGVLGELGPGNVVGFVYRSEKNAFSFESEISLFRGGVSLRNRVIFASGKHIFLFANLDKSGLQHPYSLYGEQNNSDSSWLGGGGFYVEQNNKKLIVKTELKNGKLSFKSTFSLDSELEIGGVLQTRFQIKGGIDGAVELQARLKWDLSVIKFTSEWIKSGSERESIGRAFRVDLNSKRKLSVAVMNGGDDMIGRLYQLLPTARGYRLFSVGDSTRRAVFTWEVIVDRVVISLEKVWPKSKVHEGELSSQRISLRFEVR
mgnify:CR=1 FL=1|tara:strand:- start:5726 stop:7366 length:1641 start_codon:yes stop_codon:yes gene_type:complete